MLYIDRSSLRFHVIAWLCFIVYETVIMGLFTGGFLHIVDYIIHYALNIVLFYFHTHIVLYHILGKRSMTFWILPIVVTLEIFLYILLLFGGEYLIAEFTNVSNTSIYTGSFDQNFVLRATWRALYFIGFSTGYYFLITFLKERDRTVDLEKQRLHQIIEQQKIEKELTKAQNAYLRAQINPHFLFNTLNFIYNKTRKTAPVAADAILTLSAMMRYAVETNEDKGYIFLEEEIEQVHNLIHLHKLRQNQQIYFEIQVQENTRKLNIIPLVLITLVENIFKHGNLSLANHPAHLKTYVVENNLYIESDNLINAIHNSSGLNKGLENIEKRLYNTYFDDASFFYERTPQNHFKTQVKIKLEALNVYALPLNIFGGAGK